MHQVVVAEANDELATAFTQGRNTFRSTSFLSWGTDWISVKGQIANPSLSQHTAVHRNHLPGDITGGIRAQEGDQRGYLLGLT